MSPAKSKDFFSDANNTRLQSWKSYFDHC